MLIIPFSFTFVYNLLSFTDALCSKELSDKIKSRGKLMKFFEMICRSYFSVSGCNDKLLWNYSTLKEQNAQELMEMMLTFEDEWQDQYPHTMEILDKENFIGSSVTKWTKVTLNFRITTPSWYFNAMKYIGVVKGANKDNVETNATTANTHTGDSDNGNSIVIPTDRYFNFFNEEVAEKDSSVTVGLGGMIFSGFVVGGFAAYGGLATYAIFVLIGRRMRNNDDGLGF